MNMLPFAIAPFALLVLSTAKLTALLIASGASASTIAWFLSRLSGNRRIAVMQGIISKLEERLRAAEMDLRDGKEEAINLIRELKTKIKAMKLQLKHEQDRKAA
jgi:hypothetical protein